MASRSMTKGHVRKRPARKRRDSTPSGAATHAKRMVDAVKIDAELQAYKRPREQFPDEYPWRPKTWREELKGSATLPIIEVLNAMLTPATTWRPHWFRRVFFLGFPITFPLWAAMFCSLIVVGLSVAIIESLDRGFHLVWNGRAP